MLRKILSTVMSIALLFSIMTVLPAASSNDIQEIDIKKTRSVVPYIEEYYVSNDFESHVISINRLTLVMTIDGEVYEPSLDILPKTRATIDYETALDFSYNIPWRGTVAAVGVIIATVPGIGFTIAGAIAALWATEGSPLYITGTQYQSKESYYSNYSNTYYNKVITKNICAYTDSISPNNLIYGPADGSWFDPVRP